MIIAQLYEQFSEDLPRLDMTRIFFACNCEKPTYAGKILL